MKINIDEIERLVKLQLKNGEAEELLEPLRELASQRRYGLVWEEPRTGAYDEEVVEKKLLENFPFLTELSEQAIVKDEDAPTNLLIEGDNLHVLQSMQYTHKGSVDVIYIDPPYNTGSNDFVYNDRFVDKEDAWRHSSWLSFMNKRLRLAKDLLSENGVIFISIDDNEQAQLKLMCDQIFGEDNFIANLPRIVKKGGKTTASIAKNHDYVLMYVKHNHDVFKGLPHYDKNFKHVDEHVDTRGPYKLNQTLDYNSLQYSKSMDYPLEIDGKVYYPGGNKKAHEERLSGKHNNYDWTWRWSPDLVKWGLENDWIVISKTNRIYTKTYLNARIGKDGEGNYYEEFFERTKPLFSVDLIEGKYSNDNAKKDLDKLALDSGFEFPKPVELIKTLVSLHKNKDAIVLDFFAGSGTTGEAVLELNKEDGGNRQFILCTNNEVSSSREINYLIKNNHIEAFSGRRGTLLHKAWVEELNQFKETNVYKELIETPEYKKLGIARAITYERNKRVIEGYTNSKGTEIEGLPNNLRHFTVELKRDSNDDDFNAYRLIGDTVDIIRIKENIFNSQESLTVNSIPILRMVDGKKEILIVLDVDVIDEDIVQIIQHFEDEEKEHIIYTSYQNYPYQNIKHEDLPKEILRALRMKEMN